eukprot:TRINITY_DN1414_c0_g1_i1.p1 TRINITY_DN1414_c0_g1~~TRINITY_DN1414_c0_g1_i1.p1  ORF type:complete len:402 (+),score=77.55 TRINITY_DN1414_c0_g1_i1:416-1621(+)
MEGNTLFLSLVLVVLVFLIFRLKQRRSINVHVPRAKGSSFFGAAVDYGKDPINFLLKARKDLGDVFIVDLFVIKFIFVLGGKNANKILTASEDKVSFWEMVLRFQPKFLPPKDKFNPATQMPPVYRALKPSIGTFAKVEEYRYLWIEIMNRHFEQWSQQPSIDWFVSASNLVLESAFTFYMGAEFTKNHMVSLFDDYRHLEKLMASPLFLVLPERMGPGREIDKILKKFFVPIEAEVRRRQENNLFATDVSLGAFQNILNANVVESVYGMHVLSIVFAIVVNMYPTFSWTVLHAYNSGKLHKFLEEIQSHPATDNVYPFNEMPYSEAALRETGRLYSNFLLPRVLKTPIVLQKSRTSTEEIAVYPQNNTLIVYSAAISGRDASLYENPGEWMPERFLDLER